MRFDLTDLRVFLHACDAGSMTEAATRAHLTLAAVSARIRALEESTGVQLLVRHARGVVPTAAGHAVARHARAVFHQLDALRHDLSAPAADATAPIALLGNSAALLRPLGPPIEALLAAHPDARIRVRESGSEVTVQALQRGAAELGIVSDATSVDALAAIDLGPDPLVLVVAETHPLAGRAAVSFDALLDHDWIGWDEGGALHTHLAVQAVRLGRAIRFKATVPSADAVLALVARGAGIAVVPAAMLDAVATTIPLRAVPVDEPWARRRLLLCRRPDLAHPVALALAEAIERHWPARAGRDD